MAPVFPVLGRFSGPAGPGFPRLWGPLRGGRFSDSSESNGTALAFEWATVGFKVVDQFLALHARTRGEILATLLR